MHRPADLVRSLVIGAIALFGIVALLAVARNEPGVGGRHPDPPTSTAPTPAPPGTVVVEIRPAPVPTPGSAPDPPASRPPSATGGG